MTIIAELIDDFQPSVLWPVVSLFLVVDPLQWGSTIKPGKHLMHRVNRSSETVFFTGSKIKILMSGEDTGGQFCMMEFQSPTGRSTPVHSHDREEETIHMLAGQLEVSLGSEKVIIGPGDSVLIPRHVAHRLSTLGEEDARYIVVCTPAGFDGFVAACASDNQGSGDAPLPSAADIARLREQAPRFGIHLLPAV